MTIKRATKRSPKKATAKSVKVIKAEKDEQCIIDIVGNKLWVLAKEPSEKLDYSLNIKEFNEPLPIKWHTNRNSFIKELLSDFNLLKNGTFGDASEKSTSGWDIDVTEPASAHVDLSKEWHLKDGHTAFLLAPKEAERPCFIAKHKIPTIEDSSVDYYFSGFFATHRAGGNISIDFYDKTNNKLGEQIISVPFDPKYGGGTSLISYTHIESVFTPVKGTQYMRFKIELGEQEEYSETHACLFFTGLCLSYNLEGSVHPMLFAEYSSGVGRLFNVLLENNKGTFGHIDLSEKYLGSLDSIVINNTIIINSIVLEEELGRIDFLNKKIKKEELIKKGVKIRGEIDSYNGSCLTGWASYSDSFVKLALVVNNEEKKTFIADEYRESLLLQGVNKGYAAFSIPLDIKELLNKNSRDSIDIVIFDREGLEEELDSISINPCQDIIFNIDTKEYENISGWIVDKNNDSIYIKLDIWIDGKIITTIEANSIRSDLKSKGIANFYHGFHINLGNLIENKEFVELKITYNYIKEVEVVPPVYLSSFQSKIETFINLQNFLKMEKYGEKSIAARFLTKSFLPGIIDFYREKLDVKKNNIEKLREEYNSSSVSVIIPVYKGVKETLSCIYSVVSSNNNIKFEIVVISDCSPEPMMLKELLKLQKRYKFELLSNDENLGFVGTVNKGIEFSESRDVILLNSDTIVSNYWLDSLNRVAYSSESIGTVTPISNNATICSFPAFCADNELPNGFGANLLSELCASNKAEAIDLPTAHGYCMYIKRQVIDEVGMFDVQKWGKGYGEENDFSLRASKLGWRHVMTNKTFVQHLGSVSFAVNAQSFIDNNLKKLNSLYPDYPMLVQKFIKNDPVRELRNELAEKLLLTDIENSEANLPAKGKSIIFVTLTLGGGTQVASDSLAELLYTEKQSVFYIMPIKNGLFWRVKSTITNVFADYEVETELNSLLSFLKKIDVWHIHYHNTLGFKEDIWSLPSALNCEFDITVHDYYSVCPRVDFITGNDTYCGEKGIEQCTRCLSSLGEHPSSEIKLTEFNDNIQEWRNFFYDKFKRARKVITPSKDTKTRVLNYFKLDNIECLYHPEPNQDVVLEIKQKKYDDTINIGFIGAIGMHKGVNVIKDLALEIEKQSLSINLKVIGYTSDDEYLKMFDFVHITGEYEKNDLEKLINENEIDVFFLSSICPETYSYTLTEAFSSGRHVFSFDIGAVAERVQHNAEGYCFDIGLESEIILKKIREIFLKKPTKSIRIGSEYPNILSDYYHIN